MNQIDCAAEKSAIDAALPSRKRPAVGEHRLEPRAGTRRARRRASCGGARRSDGVIAARSAPKAFRYSGGAPAKRCAAPAGCIVYGTAVQNKRRVGPLRDDLGEARALAPDRAAARARGDR